NLYVVKTLREFQYIDDDGKDQGQNVRQKAKDITNLLQDDERLTSERLQRASMRDRLTGHNDLPGDRSINNASPIYDHPGSLDNEDDEINKAIAESLKTAKEDEKNSTKEEEDLKRALKLSKEEEEKRQAMIEKQNENSLFDPRSVTTLYIQQQQLQQQKLQRANLYQTNNSITSSGSLASNFSSPNLTTSTTTFDIFNDNPQPTIKSNPTDEKYPQLAALIGSSGDGMDTFGNVGNLRVPIGSGFANTLADQSSNNVHSPRRSNSTGNISQPNPFLNSADTNNLG
ncbi:1761_t:CDS:2, partial [Scutellospora calospora]